MENDLTKLAAICASASAQDQRALMEHAYTLIFPRQYTGGLHPQSGWAGNWLEFEAMLDARAYESAALLLVPEGMATNLTTPSWDRSAAMINYLPAIAVVHAPSGKRTAEASTAGLAITAAALRVQSELTK